MSNVRLKFLMSSLHTTLDFIYEIWDSQIAKQQQHKCSPNSNIFWIRSEGITNFYFNNQTIEMTVNCVVVWISFDFNRKLGFLVFYLCRVVIFPYAADLWGASWFSYRIYFYLRI
jgi:hypothetical protein